MPVQHVTPHRVRVRFHDPDLRTSVLRGVGSRIECPVCDASRRSRSWSELRGWLREHVKEEHPEP